MSDEEGIPIDELRHTIYFEGIEIRNDAQKLLKETRDLQITFWNSFRRTQIKALTKQYDKLYEKYIRHDAQVSSYCGMASNPWAREEGETVRQPFEMLLVMNISSSGLTSQRETIRAVFQDISNQLNSLGGEANNKIVN